MVTSWGRSGPALRVWKERQPGPQGKQGWSGRPLCPALPVPPGGLAGAAQCRAVAQPCPALCDPMDGSTPGFPVLHYAWSLLKFMSIVPAMTFNHLILCRPLLLLPSLFPSIGVFSNESALHIRWPKDWSCSISPSNEYSGLISIRIDWFDLPAA